MQKLWEWAKRQLDFLDLAVAAVLGVVFTVLGLLDKATGDTLSQTAIGLLALLAFSLLRDRLGRERVERSLRDAVDTVERTVHDAQSDHPYHTRSLVLSYDLVAPDGTLAHATKLRVVRFTQANVISIADHHNTDGTLARHSIEGGAPGEPKIALPQLKRLRDDRNRPIDLVSLERPRKLGEIMEIVSHRTLHDSFTSPHEYVKFDVDRPTDQVVFDITWPARVSPQSTATEMPTAARRSTRDVSSGTAPTDTGCERRSSTRRSAR